MKRTFLCRLTSAIVALSMLLIPVPTGTFAVETGPDTAQMAATNNDIETDLELGAIPPNSQTTDNGAFPDGTDGASEPAEAFVTELPAETEATTATGEIPAETTVSEGEISDETDTATETSAADETEETEQDEIDLLELEQHIHDGITFEPLTYENNGNLYTGNYYLTEDLSGDSYEGLTINGDVKICLNGHRVDFFKFTEDSTLSIYNDDTEGMGSIEEIDTDAPQYDYGTKDSNTLNIYGGTINFYDGILRCGTINIYGGKITSSYNLYLYGSKVNISGGYFDGNTDNISIESDSELYLSGNPTIESIFVYDSTLIKIDSPLDPSFNCQISVYDGTGLFAELSDESYASESNFISPEGYTVVKVGTKLYLTDHVHEDGTEFIPWLDTENLPTESGSYYLTADVTISQDRAVIEGDENIKICLNGKKITFTADTAWFYVHNKEADLDIYDDSGEGSINNVMVGSYGGTLTLNDVTIVREHNCAVQSYDGGNVILNGTTVNGYASVRNAGTLTVNSGTIGNGECMCGIEANSGKLVVNGGSITGTFGIFDNVSGSNTTEVVINGGNICGDVRNGIMLLGGKLTVTGGTIISNNAAFGVGGAINVSDVTFDLSGDAEIDGEIRVANGCPINIVGELTNTEPYEIYMANRGVFATGKYAAQSAEKFKCARLANEGYEVVVTEDNELAIDYPHYTYGDTIELSARGHKPPPPEKEEEEEYSLRTGTSTISLPMLLSASDSVILTVNGQRANDISVDDSYNITVKISHENGFKIGENEIKAEITGTEGQYGTSLRFKEKDIGTNSDTVTVVVDPKMISAEFDGDITKPYDGNTDCKAKFTSDGFVEGDDVYITAESCKFDSADAGTAKAVTAFGLTLSGEQSECYKLEKDEIIGSGDISQIRLNIPAKKYTYDGMTIREIALDGGVNGEKVTAKLTAGSKNAGTYGYDPNDKPSCYTVSFVVNGVASDNYTVGVADPLTIAPLTAEIEWQEEASFVYDGTEKTVTAALSNKVENDDVEFEFKGNVGTEAGAYTAEVIGLVGADSANYTLENAENTEKSWEIIKADSVLTLAAESETVTYGDTVILTVTVSRKAADGIMTMSAAADEVEFCIGDNSIGKAKVTYADGSSGTAVLELPATSANYFKAGENTIRAEYGGSGDLLVGRGEIVIKVDPKTISAEFATLYPQSLLTAEKNGFAVHIRTVLELD